MDPISALIGAGASMIGGFMNTSSAQAINSANLQAQQQAASGAYLPALVANANKAGINPLAVLGYKSPGMGTAMPTDPGSGVREAGKFLSQMKDPHQVEMERIQAAAGQSNVEKLNTEISAMKLDMARQAYMMELWRTGQWAPEGMKRDWPAIGSSFFDAFSNSLGRIGAGVSGAASGLFKSWTPFDTSGWMSPYTQGVSSALGR